MNRRSNVLQRQNKPPNMCSSDTDGTKPLLSTNLCKTGYYANAPDSLHLKFKSTLFVIIYTYITACSWLGYFVFICWIAFLNRT